MLSHAVLAPPALFQLSPPYEQFEAVPDLSAPDSQQLQEAAILAVGVGSPDETWGEVAALVPGLRARYPAAPVVLRVGRPAEAGDAVWEHRAAELRVRGIVYEGERVANRLRAQLTAPIDLGGQLTE